MHEHRKTSKKSEIPKAESQFIHAQKRARTHFGIELTKTLYKDIIKSIQGIKVDGIKSEYRYQQSTRVHIHLVELEKYNLKMEVVYDCNRQSISTVMPVREGKFYPHYYDRFGNKISIFEEFNCSAIHLNDDGTVRNFGGNLKLIKPNVYKFESENLYLIMENNKLHEVLYI